MKPSVKPAHDPVESMPTIAWNRCPTSLECAVQMELGEFSTGQEWYEKAEKLGAKSHSIDQDLRGILARAVPDLRAKLCAYLLSQDEHRFAWVYEFARRPTK